MVIILIRWSRCWTTSSTALATSTRASLNWQSWSSSATSTCARCDVRRSIKALITIPSETFKHLSHFFKSHQLSSVVHLISISSSCQLVSSWPRSLLTASPSLCLFTDLSQRQTDSSSVESFGKSSAEASKVLPFNSNIQQHLHFFCMEILNQLLHDTIDNIIIILPS